MSEIQKQEVAQEENTPYRRGQRIGAPFFTGVPKTIAIGVVTFGISYYLFFKKKILNKLP